MARPIIESDIWAFRPEVAGTTATTSVDLTGFGVEALDGSIGKIDEATNDVGGSYLVVDTGPWIFGKKVLLPAGVVDRIDSADEKVYVHRTKDEIKNAPEYDPDRFDDTYRLKLGSYYGTGGAGWRDWENRGF
jgi:hypothetical protein